jgi:hypothetical protein
MSFTKLYNNKLNSTIFNVNDWLPAVKVSSIVADSIQSATVQSGSVISNQMQTVDASNGVIDLATQLYVGSAISDLVGNSSGMLDTLAEIGNAIQGDASFGLHVSQRLSDHDSHFGVIDASCSSFNTRLNNDDTHFGVIDTSCNSFTTRLNGHDTHFGLVDASCNSFMTRLNNHDTHFSAVDTSLNSLAGKTSGISYDSGSNTTTFSSLVSISLSEQLNGNCTIGNEAGDLLTVQAQTTFLNTTPQAPTPSTSDNSLKLATTAYVKNQSYLTTGNAASTYSTITNLNALQTQLNNDETNYNAHFGLVDSSLNSLQQKTSVISYNAGTDTLSLAAKVNIVKDINETSNIYLGDNSGNDVIYLQGNISASGQLITPLKMSYLSTLTGNVQNQLDQKAADSTVVHNSGNENIGGTKTFSSAPVLPNNSISNAMINNSCINSGFCDGTSSIQNQISARALDSAVVHNSGSESISGQKTFSTGITLNGTDLNTRISGIETLNTSQSSSITGLQQKTASLSYDSASDTLSLASRISISKDILENGSIYLGDSSGNDIIYIKGNLNANSSTITPVQLSYLSTLTGNVKDSLDSKATITYVDTSISSLINSAPTALNTLNELALALGNDANYSTTITTALATKAADSTVVHNSGSESISGQKTFSTGITLNGTDLNTRISGIETTNTSQSSSITSLQQKTSSLSYDSASDTLSLASRISISKDILENGSIYLGDSSGNDVVYLQANISASGQTITPAKMSYLSTLTGNVQTALDSKCADSLACHLSGSENLTGSKTFSGGVVLSSNITANGATISPTELSYIDGTTSNLQLQINGKQNTLTFDSTPTSGSSNPATSGGIYTALGTKQATLTFDSTPTVSSSNPCTSGGIYTALGTKQATLTFDSTPTVSSSNPCTSGGIYTALGTKQATLTFDSTPTASSSNPCTSGGIYTALGTKQATLTFDSTPTVSSSNPCTSGGIYTALGTKQATLTFDSAPTASSSNPCTSGGIYTALGTKQGTLTFDSTPTASSSNPCTSGGTYTALQSYLTTSSAASTYATLSAPALTGNPTTTTQSSSDNSTRIASTAYVQSNLSNYGTLASSSTYSGNNTFSSYNHVNQFGELIHNAGSGSSLSLTYTSIKGVVYYTPSANFTLTLSSVPSPTSNLETYSITLIYNAKYYANAISVNGSSYTMIAGAGLSNISINASATYVMQQINICYLNSSTPTVITNVLSLW